MGTAPAPCQTSSLATPLGRVRPKYLRQLLGNDLVFTRLEHEGIHSYRVFSSVLTAAEHDGGRDRGRHPATDRAHATGLR